MFQGSVGDMLAKGVPVRLRRTGHPWSLDARHPCRATLVRTSPRPSQQMFYEFRFGAGNYDSE